MEHDWRRTAVVEAPPQAGRSCVTIINSERGLRCIGDRRDRCSDYRGSEFGHTTSLVTQLCSTGIPNIYVVLLLTVLRNERPQRKRNECCRARTCRAKQSPSISLSTVQPCITTYLVDYITYWQGITVVGDRQDARRQTTGIYMPYDLPRLGIKLQDFSVVCARPSIYTLDGTRFCQLYVSLSAAIFE